MALYGAAVAAVALHLTLGRRPGSRTEWLAARLGSLRHTLRLPHHGMHCLEPSSRLVHSTALALGLRVTLRKVCKVILPLLNVKYM